MVFWLLDEWEVEMRRLQRRCIYCRENGPRVMTFNGARWGSVRLRYCTSRTVAQCLWRSPFRRKLTFLQDRMTLRLGMPQILAPKVLSVTASICFLYTDGDSGSADILYRSQQRWDKRWYPLSMANERAVGRVDP